MTGRMRSLLTGRTRSARHNAIRPDDGGVYPAAHGDGRPRRFHLYLTPGPPTFLSSSGETMSSMREYRDYMARASKCEQKAKAARPEDEKQSWLAMADSWRATAELHQMLKPELPLAEKAVG